MHPIAQTIRPRQSASAHRPERKGIEKFHAALKSTAEQMKRDAETCPLSTRKLAAEAAALAIRGKERPNRVAITTASKAPPMPAMEEIARARPMTSARTPLAAPISPK